jgi:hypothetical protein
VLAPLCAFVPMMADLDHDIDLTQQSGPADAPPADEPLHVGTEATTP